jgi:Mitochondrial carrier protein
LLLAKTPRNENNIINPSASLMNENHARLSPALVETIAGLSAGTISTLAVHPLDVIKTRLQSVFSLLLLQAAVS